MKTEIDNSNLSCWIDTTQCCCENLEQLLSSTDATSYSTGLCIDEKCEVLQVFIINRIFLGFRKLLRCTRTFCNNHLSITSAADAAAAAAAENVAADDVAADAAAGRFIRDAVLTTSSDPAS